MSILGELSKLVYGKGTPADAAMPYLNQIPGMEKEAYGPYQQYGMQAGATMSPIFQQMSQDPTGYLNKLMASYQPSDAYKFQQGELTKAAANAAAAGGYAGAPADVEAQSKLTNQLLSQDMQQWLQNAMGIQGQGLGGEQNLYNTGFGATQGMTSDLANLYGTQGQLAFQGAQQQRQQQQDLLRGLFGLGNAWMTGPMGTPKVPGM